ncbi:phosphoesterase [Brachyspira innocens]|uniref:phosphoesterase n=1 Tax=Brachyspira innocens TaxID=13264 RepID=UPI000364CF46|nr:phosphoesterase [Brachyspira innocens]
MIYFTSDTHFFYMHSARKKVFDDCNSMHNILIDNWNKKVSDKDDIYIVGDFSNEKGYIKTSNILKILKGNKYLIKGNNDKFIDNDKFDKKLFLFIKDYHVLNIEEYNKKIKNIVLFHYPILEWEGYYNNAVLIHGHWHNDRKYHKRAFNAACDIHNYSPISIDEILKMVMYE